MRHPPCYLVPLCPPLVTKAVMEYYPRRRSILKSRRKMTQLITRTRDSSRLMVVPRRDCQRQSQLWNPNPSTPAASVGSNMQHLLICPVTSKTHRSLDSQQAKKCPHCNKVYVSMPALSMHILTHELKHKCTVCSKSFSRPWLLQGHMRSHTGEKPYGCAHCGKAFADRSNLRAHMQTHSVFKSFECKRCLKSFALKSYLNKHYESACIKDTNVADTDYEMKPLVATQWATIFIIFIIICYLFICKYLHHVNAIVFDSFSF